jgi:magnesium-transporting ATPase (P-type)
MHVHMLSAAGESVPVRKAAYDPELDGTRYNPDTFNHCTLFNGSVVSAVRGGRGGRPALAVVSATGFNTAKGQLLRTIMYPRPHDLQFVKQVGSKRCACLCVQMIAFLCSYRLACAGSSLFRSGHEA